MIRADDVVWGPAFRLPDTAMIDRKLYNRMRDLVESVAMLKNISCPETPPKAWVTEARSIRRALQPDPAVAAVDKLFEAVKSTKDALLGTVIHASVARDIAIKAYNAALTGDERGEG